MRISSFSFRTPSLPGSYLILPFRLLFFPRLAEASASMTREITRSMNWEAVSSERMMQQQQQQTATLATDGQDFSYERTCRVPMNSAATRRDFFDGECYSQGSFSTYNIWSPPIKRTVTTKYIDGAVLTGLDERSSRRRSRFPKIKLQRKSTLPPKRKLVIVSLDTLIVLFRVT